MKRLDGASRLMWRKHLQSAASCLVSIPQRAFCRTNYSGAIVDVAVSCCDVATRMSEPWRLEAAIAVLVYYGGSLTVASKESTVRHVSAISLATIGILIAGACTDRISGTSSAEQPSSVHVQQSSAVKEAGSLQPDQVCAALSTAQLRAVGLRGSGIRDDYPGAARCRWPLSDYDLNIAIEPDVSIDLQFEGRRDFETQNLEGVEVRFFDAHSTGVCGYVFPYGHVGSMYVVVDYRNTDNVPHGRAGKPCAIGEAVVRYVVPKVPS